MCYIDPPFFSQRDYKSFVDKWDGISSYINYMERRVRWIYGILKDTGSIFLHCDWHASHWLRVMLEEIFGEKNFRNEIIWSYSRWTAASNSFQKMHDNIYLYSKSKDYKFKPTYKEATEGQRKKHKKGWDRNKVTIKGKKQPQLIVYDKENVDKAINQGKINVSEFGKIIEKAEKKTQENDVWKINAINSQAKERTGYPTQKPEKLLERIIKCSTNEGDIVLDCFGGSGTTAAVAHKLGRRFITGDNSQEAINIIRRRLRDK